MVRWITKGSTDPARADKAEGDPAEDRRSISRADRLEILAAACQGTGECPAWIVMELEASEKADRETAFEEEERRRR